MSPTEAERLRLDGNAQYSAGNLSGVKESLLLLLSSLLTCQHSIEEVPSRAESSTERSYPALKHFRCPLRIGMLQEMHGDRRPSFGDDEMW
jgi:hypothetical protein